MNRVRRAGWLVFAAVAGLCVADGGLASVHRDDYPSALWAYADVLNLHAAAEPGACADCPGTEAGPEAGPLGWPGPCQFGGGLVRTQSVFLSPYSSL